MEQPMPPSRRTQAATRQGRSFSRAAIFLGSIASLSVVLLLLWFVLLPSFRVDADAGASDAQSMTFTSAFDAFDVSGRVGATPVVTLKEPVAISGSKDRVLIEGGGRTIEENTPVVLAITAFDGETGDMLNPTGQSKLQVGFADEQTFAPDLLKVILGRSEGSRIVVVRHLSSDAVASGAFSDYEIDVIDILPSIATGAEQPENNGTPLNVELSETGPRASHGQDVPKGLTTQVLLKGDGPQVQADGRIIAQYSLASWTDGIVRQSTWNRGIPEMIDLSTAMPGLVQALADQRVGSRIAVTIPPDLATGDDTMVAVVDILAASNAAPVAEQADAPASK